MTNQFEEVVELAVLHISVKTTQINEDDRQMTSDQAFNLLRCNGEIVNWPQVRIKFSSLDMLQYAYIGPKSAKKIQKIHCMITSNAKINIFCDSFLQNNSTELKTIMICQNCIIFHCRQSQLSSHVIDQSQQKKCNFFFKNEMKKKVNQDLRQYFRKEYLVFSSNVI